jgi:excisionase family DNA binding protein
VPDNAQESATEASRRPAQKRTKSNGRRVSPQRQHKDSKVAVEEAVADGTLPRRALRLFEAAATLGISRWHLDKLIEAGEIGTVRLGSLRVIPTSEIDRLLTARLERQEATK